MTITITTTLLLGGCVLALLHARRARARELREATLMAVQAATVSGLRATLQELPQELARARRYQRSISVIVLQLEVPPAAAGDLSAPAQVLLTHAAFVAQVLNASLRSSDTLSYDPKENRYVLALLETDRDQARQFIHRLTRQAEGRGSFRFSAGMAEFPSDALTFEELISRAAAGCAGEERAPSVTLNQAAAGRGVAAGQ